MYNYFLAAILFIHAIAHLPGFLVAWKLIDLKEMPFNTKIFLNKLELGISGVKIWGLVWLLLSVLFFISTIFILIEFPVFKETIIAASILSFFLSILGLPESKFGIVVNVLIVIYVTMF